LIEFEGDYVYAALDYRAAENEKETTDDTPSNYRDEPVAFFFIIYGLCFQTLIKMVNKSDAQTNRVITTVLRALRRFLRPSISGNAMYKNFVFAETTDLLDRLVLMESPEVQSMVVQITINLARNHPGALQSIGNERYFTRGFC
jgi:HEAT repeat-containing protein 5